MHLRQNLNARQEIERTWVVEKSETVLRSKGSNRMLEQCGPIKDEMAFIKITWRGTVLHFSFVPVLSRSRRANVFSC